MYGGISLMGTYPYALRALETSDGTDMQLKEKPRRGIQSVETGAALLQAMTAHVSPMHLRELARAAGLTPGKAHPYLVSFVKVGFMIQDAAGRYALGPLALQLGLASLQRLDPIKAVEPLLEGLVEQTGQSVALSVWGNQGPTIVRLEEPVHPLHVNLRPGSVMGLTNTATGRLFVAYMPSKVIEATLAQDSAPIARAAFEKLVAETRARGLSRTLGQPIAGIDAFCAPVFDSTGNLALGITAMGATEGFDRRWNGVVANALRDCAQTASARLGWIARPHADADAG